MRKREKIKHKGVDKKRVKSCWVSISRHGGPISAAPAVLIMNANWIPPMNSLELSIPSYFVNAIRTPNLSILPYFLLVLLFISITFLIHLLCVITATSFLVVCYNLYHSLVVYTSRDDLFFWKKTKTFCWKSDYFLAKIKLKCLSIS